MSLNYALQRIFLILIVFLVIKRKVVHVYFIAKCKFQHISRTNVFLRESLETPFEDKQVCFECCFCRNSSPEEKAGLDRDFAKMFMHNYLPSFQLCGLVHLLFFILSIAKASGDLNEPWGSTNFLPYLTCSILKEILLITKTGSQTLAKYLASC